MRAARSFAFDLIAVVAFVTIGRRNHEEGLTVGGIVETAAPFVIALIVGWALMQAWRRPDNWVVGVGIWAVTLVGGMVLRRLVFDEGTALSFVVVASLFTAVTIIGWRLLATFVHRDRPRAPVVAQTRE